MPQFRILKALVFLAAVSLFSSNSLIAQTGYGTVLFENRTAVILDFYARGEFQCRALSGGVCASQVRAGSDIPLQAVASNEGRVSSNIDQLDSGDTHTWVISE